MNIFYTVSELQEAIAKLKKEGKSIGFVPTMGALHDGHLSLVKKSKEENDIVVSSIFVNPIQFNNKSDLKKYPREEELDSEKLKSVNCDIIFCPSEKEMYPEPDTRVFEFGALDKVMEGKYRDGHFNGVAIVVSRLFDMVKPDKAYFGQKDFQQLAIIKNVTKQLNLPIEVIGCPIIREKSGLAMSSRNALLSEQDRNTAVLISKTLFKAQELTNQITVEELKKWVIEQINTNKDFNIEYFDIVDDETLTTVNNWKEKNAKIGCIAAYIGGVRLIDNITFNL